MTDKVILNVFRGDREKGEMIEYEVPLVPGMVVLDAALKIQVLHAPDLAVRWNCKIGKCGSCSAEVNGKPRLMCMDRLDKYPEGTPVSVRPMKTFPVIKDLVTDVSWNYEVNKKIPPFKIRAGERRYYQYEADRVQEFRKCIECFLCQDVCHVLREHQLKDSFCGPRYLVRVAGLEMHPLDEEDRSSLLKEELGIGFCNITKCCTEVCPENITITDNAIIPLKERIVDKYFDPLRWLWKSVFSR